MKLDWKKLLITTGILVFATAVVGGTTWYLMDQNAKKDKEQYEKQISELEEQVDVDEAEPSSAQASPTTTAVKASTEKEEITSFCTSGGENLILGSYQHVNNENGDFVLCKVGLREGSGFVIYGKKISNKWSKIIQTQENPSVEMANQYKIPRELYLWSPEPTDEIQQWKY